MDESGWEVYIDRKSRLLFRRRQQRGDDGFVQCYMHGAWAELLSPRLGFAHLPQSTPGRIRADFHQHAYVGPVDYEDIESLEPSSLDTEVSKTYALQNRANGSVMTSLLSLRVLDESPTARSDVFFSHVTGGESTPLRYKNTYRYAKNSPQEAAQTFLGILKHYSFSAMREATGATFREAFKVINPTLDLTPITKLARKGRVTNKGSLAARLRALRGLE